MFFLQEVTKRIPLSFCDRFKKVFALSYNDLYAHGVGTIAPRRGKNLNNSKTIHASTAAHTYANEGKKHIKDQSNILTEALKPPWRNRLARSAVNRKVGGSSPPGGALFNCNWAAADDGAIRESVVVIYDEACEGLAALLPGGGASILGVTAVKVPPAVGNKVAVPVAVAVGTVGGEAATAAKAAMVGLVRVAAAEICAGTNGVAGLMAVPGTAGFKFPKTDVAVGVLKALIPHKPCSCCNFFWSFSFCVSANFTTNGAEQPSIVWL
ncbi:hypothetical protein GQX74_010213 [Glossina fuscipes]|nr:hypothetical protein GQX74_010213 [Glossina fuscipes]